MRVPTCQLQHGFGPDAGGIVPYPEQRIALQQDAEAFYGRRGVNILATCTPYQVGNIPVRGEHCAWMESSAVVYANSVLGARTNCEGTASTGAASLTGKIPCWGNHRPENRYGTHLIEVARRWTTSWTGACSAISRRRGRRGAPVLTGDLGPRTSRPEALRRGRGVLRRGRAVPHSRDYPRGADARGRFRRRETSEPAPYGPAERRAITRRSTPRATDRRRLRPARLPARLDRPGPPGRRGAGRPPAAPGTELWLMLPRALRAWPTAAGTPR